LTDRITVTIREIGPELAQAKPGINPPIKPPIKPPFNPPFNNAKAPVFMGPVNVNPGLIGFTHNGTITNNDSRERNHLCKVFTVNMQANKTYIIQNNSAAFDAYLMLQDANGNTIMENDDFAGLNSQISYRALNAGVYRVVVTSLGGQGTGPFQLRIRQQ
jgi:hypothetical protein